MTKSQILYINHIIESINLIQEFILGHNESSFAIERMRYDAILRNLQTISEATQKLSQEIKSTHSNIPWRDISGFRNILVHDYLDGIDKEIIWSIIAKELPIIKLAMVDSAKKANII